MIKELGKSIGNVIVENVGRASSRVQERKPLPVDLLESDDAFLAVFDAPGATQSDVQVRFAENTIHVRVDRFRDFHDGYEMRFPGRGLSLDGSVKLPPEAEVDTTDATAKLTKNGTLHVRVPKVQETEVTVEDEEDEVIEMDDVDESDVKPAGTDDIKDTDEAADDEDRP
ncbi:Hsp20/alpha crystallin family protein [Haladaptatus sp. QDMS2]|uniref:Hsp20/alpha crystallin family protein n=1 Tax=Haladaptatus sp. QDMS2 TaxID=3033391 RepID=UPI0023E88CE3|nr:Hsp20 family protein [Haladaptatus sp. QDMS2]